MLASARGSPEKIVCVAWSPFQDYVAGRIIEYNVLHGDRSNDLPSWRDLIQTRGHGSWSPTKL